MQIGDEAQGCTAHVCSDTAWHDATRHKTTQHDTVRHGTEWYRFMQCSSVPHYRTT